MITSTQTTNTEIFAFKAVLIFTLLRPRILFINRKDNRNCSKVGYFSKKLADFAGKLRQNYKQLKCELFWILLKYISDHLSVLSQFA